MYIQAMAETVLPKYQNHPNKLQFVGVLTFLDRASNKPPNGAGGHNIILLTNAAKEAINSLIGMGICVSSNLEKHNDFNTIKNKIGIITKAYIFKSRLIIRGILYPTDFPDQIKQLRLTKNLGMSFELANSYVENLNDSIWIINKTVFTGASVLIANKAAYSKTKFYIAKS